MKSRTLMVILCILVLAAMLFTGCSQTVGTSDTETNNGTNVTQGNEEMRPDILESDESQNTEVVNLENNSLTINGGAVIPLSGLEYRTENEHAPAVYYISDITPESLILGVVDV
ncbi:MAG: hypothetical protein LUF78_08885 [Clostridiales bacterium]|nr:hypothetical protein [Clostridiales bacterium]